MAYEVGGGFGVRPRRTLRGTLMVVVLLLLVCFVGAAGLAAWNYQALRGHTGAVRRAADGFFGEVTGGDPVRAYGRLCASARSRWGREEFVARLAVPPRIVGYRIVGVRVDSRGGEPRGTVTVRLTRQSGVSGERRLPVVREGGEWRVCGDPL